MSLRNIESTTKTIAVIITSVGIICGLLLKITFGIVNINKIMEKMAISIPLVDEHSKFVETEIDYMIENCMTTIAKGEPIQKNYLDKLLIYRDTLPLSVNYKQKMNINYIEQYEKKIIK
jgi:hypothetical protein